MWWLRPLILALRKRTQASYIVRSYLKIKQQQKSPQKQNYKISKQLQQTSKKQNPTNRFTRGRTKGGCGDSIYYFTQPILQKRKLRFRGGML